MWNADCQSPLGNIVWAHEEVKWLFDGLADVVVRSLHTNGDSVLIHSLAAHGPAQPHRLSRRLETGWQI